MKKNTNIGIGNIIFNICNYTFQAIFSLICIYPFYYIFINSLSSPTKAESMHVLFLPVEFTFNTYIQVLKMPQIYTGLIVSLSRTVIGTILTLFVTSMFAYATTKNELFLRKTLYRIVIASMYINAGLIPWYITMMKYGLKNNFLLYVLPTAMNAFLLILIRTYMQQIPPSLEESALIDGAGYFRIFTKIVFPVSMPVIAACAVFSGVSQWNSWADNFFLVSKENLQTLQLILLNILRQSQQLLDLIRQENDYESMNVIKITPESIKLAVTMIVTVPIFLLYPFCQRYFVKGIMMGSIKG
jgi:putative aldouronate transport system permease protein